MACVDDYTSRSCFALRSSYAWRSRVHTNSPIYAGTWQANFRGTPFITINLMIEKDGHLTGSAGVGDINATPSGEITNVEAPANESPIVSNRLLDSGDLELTSRGDDPADKIILVLELTGAQTGFVRFGIAMGHDATVVKPIAVQKIEPKT